MAAPASTTTRLNAPCGRCVWDGIIRTLELCAVHHAGIQ
jgi:hypothetical protein